MNQRVLVLNNGNRQFETIQSRVGVTKHNGTTGLQLNLVVDTGATHTAIARRHADMLNLAPVRQVWINTASGRELCPVYRIDMHIQRFVLRGIEIVGIPLPSDDLLLGMDVIGKCIMQMGPTRDGDYAFMLRFPDTLQ